MDNRTVAAVFEDIADLLEMKGESSFRIRAYRRAAEAIARLPEEITRLMHEGRLTSIPGVGEGIARRIQELVMTDRLAYYDELRAEFPEGIGRLLEVPGIGPKTADRLSKELGVGSIEELEKAIADGRVAAVPRMGEKTAENLRTSIEAMKHRDRRTSIGHAWPIAQELLANLRKVTYIRHVTEGGSLRRMRETVGDIDIVGSSEDTEAAIEAFVNLPMVTQVISRENEKVNALVRGGLEVEFLLCDPSSFGAFLLRHTGSKRHIALLSEWAQRLGLRLEEEGLVQVDGARPRFGESSRPGIRAESFATEAELYHRLGLQYVPPELREGSDEIEVASRNRLPNLLGPLDIRGDLHMHTVWSDGLDTAETMARAAIRRGYDYIAITDHSGGLGVAHGLTPDRVRKQIEEIRELNRRLDGIRVLAGIEVDIKADGSLDLPDDLLADLDVVVASVHSAMGQDEEKMTKRLLSAIANPNVDIIGHPTCRIVGGREPISVDMDAVFRAAAQSGTAMEINAAPSRLDLKDDLVRRAKEAGVKIAISTDAHNLDQLDFMHFGVGVARRGWCEALHVLNTQSLDELLAFLKRQQDVGVPGRRGRRGGGQAPALQTD